MKIKNNTPVLVVQHSGVDQQGNSFENRYIRGIKMGANDPSGTSDFSDNIDPNDTVTVIMNGVGQIDVKLGTYNPAEKPLIDNFGSIYFKI